MRMKQYDRSKQATFDIKKNNKFLADSFVAQAIPIYNSFPSNVIKTTSRASLKKRIEKTVLERSFEGPKSN